MTPETAHLTFSLHRAARLATDGALWQARRELGTDDHLALLRQLDRALLAARASGIHATREEAEAYARREGPMLLATPEGEVVRIERARDAGEDARVAADERAFAERLRRTHPRASVPHRDHLPPLT